LITLYPLATRKTNFCFPFQFVANRLKFAVSVSRLQQTNGNGRFLLVPFVPFRIFEEPKLFVSAPAPTYEKVLAPAPTSALWVPVFTAFK
jgi:hypothetical protein